MDKKINIYHIGGMFLIFNKDDAIELRRTHRIIGQLIGCSPKIPHQIVTSGLPYLISTYATKIIFDKKIAKFFRLTPKPGENSLENNEYQYSQELLRLKKEAEQEFLEKRTMELKKRKIEAPVGNFDESKMKLSISYKLDTNYHSFDTVEMQECEVDEILSNDDDKMVVFRDLHLRGTYISSGMKFGSDFLVYLGDSVRYHAQYAVRIVASIEGRVDLGKTNYSEINALNRLCHSANKTPLFAVVDQETGQVNYWTVKPREYLTPDSSNSTFISHTLWEM